ncbi:ATP-binding cassette domain-containing protein [Paenibacillus amylolyticus]|uniref:ATP-binding cassette domain-containing protein n=1 Tax=Paenibacillus amylolyticus TaxID=1451 RepID=A0A5M9WQ77_PAEAM|nr:ATP-binding cassette domain-containing protein [Paenibacillus amylolyticus]KAA8783774.1 ATP-binding cassette domain-containing protein [Paenibacillus amylolyticus]
MQDKLPIISLLDVRVYYAAESGEVKKALDGVSLTLKAGEWLSIVGANGSGKSTLAGLLLGFIPVSGGERNIPASLVIRGVLQQPEAQVLGDTIEEEFHFALSHLHISGEEKARRRQEALHLVGLHHPLDTVIARLSGGQKQLLNIATALAVKPDVLVMDEPAAMLDPDARDRIERIVQSVTSHGTAVVWITHHLEEATLCDRIMAMSKGKCVYDGIPESFFYPEVTAMEAKSDTKSYGWHLSPCEEAGLEPPFTVKTCLILKQRGKLQDVNPLRPEQLAKEAARW